MCGIVGYVGKKNCIPILINGLKRLEYRGYDSAGIGFFSLGSTHVIKSKGKVSLLEEKLNSHVYESHLGIGHTRWATHGVPNEVEGTYGLAVIYEKEPDKIIAARKGSPLVLGIGEGENFIASDVSAVLAHTNQVVYMEDGEIVEVFKDKFITRTIHDEEIQKEVHEISLSLDEIDKGGYSHFMLKEIMEQPDSVTNSMRGRLLLDDGSAKLGGLDNVLERLANCKRIIISACGTSWHAGLVGEYMFEQYAHIPTEVEYASEFRYRSPIIYPDDAIFFISQSGETADTLAAMKEAKSKGALTLGICNVVGSSIARESMGGVYTHAGPEIGVASTKAFTSQLVVLSLITLLLARKRGMDLNEGQCIAEHLSKIPDQISKILELNNQIEFIASEFQDAKNFLYLGRGFNFPVALEGALKLKEISYIHAEGYPAAEMKHGPIALIDE